MLKFRKLLCGAVAAIVAVTPLSAFAEVTMTAAGDDGKIHIYGSLGKKTTDEFIIKVIKEQDGTLTESNIASSLIALEQVSSETDGSFTMDIPVSVDAESGMYLVQLTTKNSKSIDKEIPFYYLSETEREDIIKNINAADSAEKVKSLVLNNADKLNISLTDVYATLDNTDGVFNRIIYIKGKKPFEKLGEIQQAFMESCVLEALQECGDESAVISCISNHNDLLKVDYEKAEALENTLALGKRLLNKKFNTVTDFQTRFDEIICTEAFNQGTRSEMKELIDEYADKINISSKYTTATEKKKSELYKALESKSAFDKYSDITKYITEWFDSNTGSTGQSSGGSMGGSGNRLGTGMTNEVTTDNNKTNQSSSALTPATKFTDLSDAAWAVEAIEYLANQKIINGVSENSFEPNRSITREEFVKILVGAFNIELSGKETEFSDVVSNSWYAPYVYAAAENDIVRGITEDVFGVGEEITRQDMAVMLCRVLEFKKQQVGETVEMPDFSDKSEIADYAADAVSLLCKGGIMNGVSQNEFDPDGRATRAMAAKVIYLLISIQK